MHLAMPYDFYITLKLHFNFLGSSFTEDDGQRSSAYSMVGKFPKQNAQSHAIMGIHTHTHTHLLVHAHSVSEVIFWLIHLFLHKLLMSLVGLDVNDWATICGYLHKMNRSQIHRLGGELGLIVFNLEEMQTLPNDMVKAWLRKEDKVKEKSGDPLTWNILVKTLHKIGQNGIADDILREKCARST